MRYATVRSICLALSLGIASPCLLGSVTPAVAAELGLKERRAVKAYEDTVLPAQVKALEAAAGFAVPVEPQWDSLALADQVDSFSEDWYLTDVFFKPLAKALASVARDDMGKEALKATLKKIVLKYDAATAPASAYKDGITFEDGTLTLNFKPGSNAQDIDDRAKAIEDVLLSEL